MYFGLLLGGHVKITRDVSARNHEDMSPAQTVVIVTNIREGALEQTLSGRPPLTSFSYTDGLFCGAGLTPTPWTASRAGGTAGSTDFGVGPPTCPDPVPSSALVIARATTLVSSGTWSPTALGGAYALLVGLVVGLARVGGVRADAGGARVAVPCSPSRPPPSRASSSPPTASPRACSARHRRRRRFAAVLVTRREHRAERMVALVLIAAGGLVATTAKVAYIPVLGAAVIVCALPRPWGPRPRRVGPAIALVTCLLAVTRCSLRWTASGQVYDAVNAHDLVFTTALLELGPSAAGDSGLPRRRSRSGNGRSDGPPPRRHHVVGGRDPPAPVRDPCTRPCSCSPSTRPPPPGRSASACRPRRSPTSRTSTRSRRAVRGPSAPYGHPGWSVHASPTSRRSSTTPPAPVAAQRPGPGRARAAATARWQGRAGRWSLPAGLAAGTALALSSSRSPATATSRCSSTSWLAAYLLAVSGSAWRGPPRPPWRPSDARRRPRG